MNNSDDLFIFSDDEQQALTTKKVSTAEAPYSFSLPPWKILVVDDEEDIHRTTRLVLNGLTFRGRGIELLHAHSGAEAHALLLEHQDIGLVLLDVVMESDDAGLQLAKTIRYEMKNSCIQIILRTGQPGLAPEQEVMTRYEINDYKAKTELTAAKLHTSICAGLRAFELADSLNETINHLEVELENRRKTEAELITHKEHLEELVTERTGALQDAHDKLKLQQQQIVYAEEMAGIGQSAAGVAHEINNPIAFSQANLGVMGEYVGVFKALLKEYEELRTLTEKEQLAATTNHSIAELRREEDADYMVEDIDSLQLDSVYGATRV